MEWKFLADREICDVIEEIEHGKSATLKIPFFERWPISNWTQGRNFTDILHIE